MPPKNSASLPSSALKLTALIMAHGLTAGTHAQSTNQPPAAPASTDAPAKLPDVIVRGAAEAPYKPEVLSSPKYTEPLRDVPQTITVVPKAVIDARGATTLRDVLRNVPGISVQAGEGGGGLPGDNISIRGFNARSDIFIDGIRDFGAYSRDPFDVEQVEVAKGPTSATTGRGSTGGSVNLVSKTPRLDPFYTGTAGFGTDDYKRVTGDLNQPLEELGLKGTSLRLNGVWHDAGAAGRDVVEDSRWSVAPSVALGLGTPTRLTLSYLHMEQDNVPDYGIPWVPAGNTNAVLSRYINEAPPVDYENFYGLRDYDFEDLRTQIATGLIEHDFSDSVTLRNISRYGRTFRNSAITAPRFADLDPGPATVSDTLINRQLQRRKIDSEILANVTDVRLDFETGPVGHAVVAGFEATREDQDNQNSAQATNQPQTDIFSPNPNAQPLGPMPPITGAPNDARAITLAPYIFETLKLGEHWQLNGGLRFDHFDSDYSTPTTNFSRTDDLLSWRAGIVFKPKSNGSIYFGYGTSFNPSLEGNTGFALATNTVNLDPEETRTFELGTKWDFLKERLQVNAAIFHTTKFNARTPGLNPGDPQTVLDGEQIVKGLELGVAGSLTDKWSVFGGYTYLDTKIRTSNTAGEQGAEFSNSPDHSFSLWTTYALPWNLEIGGGAQFVGLRLNSSSSSPTVREAPSYTLFDAMLAYRASKNLTLRLNVYNLANEEYIDRVGGGHFVPGVGRSATLTASLTF